MCPMKKSILILILLFTVILNMDAQERRYNGLLYRGRQRLIPCMDMAGGFIWDNKYEKFTISTTFNNLYLKRWGGFAMIELDPVEPAIVIGPTISINDFAYVYTGFDFLTSRGYFARGGLKHARKDLGIGFYPVKWATFKLCHSFNAGSRFEVGFRIPLERESDYIRSFRRSK
jgi:hypothetical protein